jgi:hypothetical protein
LLAEAASTSNFEPVEMDLCVGGWPTRQHRAICAGRSLKRTATTNVISVGSYLSSPPMQMPSMLVVAEAARQHKCHQCWRLLRPPATESIFHIFYIIPHNCLLFVYNLSFSSIIFFILAFVCQIHFNLL